MTEQERERIIAEVKEANPDVELYTVEIPECDELIICRKLKWGEYKSLIGKGKPEESMDNLLSKALVYPKYHNAEIAAKWDGGLVLTIGEQIQTACGYRANASVKNL